MTMRQVKQWTPNVPGESHSEQRKTHKPEGDFSTCQTTLQSETEDQTMDGSLVGRITPRQALLCCAYPEPST